MPMALVVGRHLLSCSPQENKPLLTVKIMCAFNFWVHYKIFIECGEVEHKYYFIMARLRSAERRLDH